ncbi:DUF221-domain-containing protein [Ramicandelaber brevisporus]|nr:DUF221-domain-containing protein [Ramicandelaber brevisporus]
MQAMMYESLAPPWPPTASSFTATRSYSLFDGDDPGDGPGDDPSRDPDRIPGTAPYNANKRLNILTQLTVASIICMLCLIGFAILRTRWARMYSPRMRLRKNRPPAISPGFFSWLSPVWRASDAFILRTVGLDALLYLRFIRMCFQLFAVMCIFGTAIIWPINIFFNHRNDDKDKDDGADPEPSPSPSPDPAGAVLQAISHATESSSGFSFTNSTTSPPAGPPIALPFAFDYLSAHLTFTYIFTMMAYLFLYRFTCQWLSLRWHFLRQTRASLASRTIMLSGIPKSLRNADSLKLFYDSLNLGGTVEAAYICPTPAVIEHLESLTHQRAVALRRLEEAYTAALGNPCVAPGYNPAKLRHVALQDTPQARAKENAMVARWMAQIDRMEHRKKPRARPQKWVPPGDVVLRRLYAQEAEHLQRQNHHHHHHHQQHSQQQQHQHQQSGENGESGDDSARMSTSPSSHNPAVHMGTISEHGRREYASNEELIDGVIEGEDDEHVHVSSSCCSIIGIGGKWMDNIDYWRIRFMIFDEAVKKVRLQFRSSYTWENNTEEQPSSPISATFGSDAEEAATRSSVAFITFQVPAAAHIACNSMTAASLSHMHAAPAPEPRDLIWYNLPLSMSARFGRSILSSLALILLIFFWIVPVASVASLVSLPTLVRWFPFLEKLAEWSPLANTLLTVTLPSLILPIFLASQPTLFGYIAHYLEGLRSKSEVDLAVLSRYFFSLICNVLLLFTVSSATLNALWQIWADPHKLPEKLAMSLPSAAPFFTNWVIMLGIGFAPLQLFQFGAVLLYIIRRALYSSTPRDHADEAQYPTIVSWGTLYPTSMLVFILGLTYSTLEPQILLAVTVFFGFTYIAQKYLVLYVYTYPSETAGAAWPYTLRRLIVTMFIHQILMFGFFALRKHVILSSMMVPLMIMNLIFYRRVGLKLCEEKGGGIGFGSGGPDGLILGGESSGGSATGGMGVPLELLREDEHIDQIRRAQYRYGSTSHSNSNAHLATEDDTTTLMAGALFERTRSFDTAIGSMYNLDVNGNNRTGLDGVTLHSYMIPADYYNEFDGSSNNDHNNENENAYIASAAVEGGNESSPLLGNGNTAAAAATTAQATQQNRRKTRTIRGRVASWFWSFHPKSFRDPAVPIIRIPPFHPPHPPAAPISTTGANIDAILSPSSNSDAETPSPLPTEHLTARPSVASGVHHVGSSRSSITNPWIEASVTGHLHAPTVPFVSAIPPDPSRSRFSFIVPSSPPTLVQSLWAHLPRAALVALAHSDHYLDAGSHFSPSNRTDYRESSMMIVDGVLDSGIHAFEHPAIGGTLPSLWLPVPADVLNEWSHEETDDDADLVEEGEDHANLLDLTAAASTSAAAAVTRAGAIGTVTHTDADAEDGNEAAKANSGTVAEEHESVAIDVMPPTPAQATVLSDSEIEFASASATGMPQVQTTTSTHYQPDTDSPWSD